MGYFPCQSDQIDQSHPSVLEWEEVPCPLCRSEVFRPLLEAPDRSAGSCGLWFAVVQCRQCGLCLTNPRPTARCMGQFYPANYGPYQPPSPRKRLRRIPLLRSLDRAKRERNMLTWQGQGRLLDFGCGNGDFLFRMHRQGWTVTGLDVSPTAVERIRQNLGLPVLLGTLPHPDLRPQSFDVITMWEVLEHVHNPLQVLRAAYDLLTPGGRLIVSTPNIESLPFRWFGAFWFALDVPRHLTHFAPWTLHNSLEQAGFRVRTVQPVRHANWLRCSAESASQAGRKGIWCSLLKTKWVSRFASLYCSLVHQSDCMLAVAERCHT